MAQFLRGKQAGIQKDLSEGLAPDLFVLDDVCLGGRRHRLVVFPLYELLLTDDLDDIVRSMWNKLANQRACI